MPAALTTVTSTVPSAWAGAVTVMEVSLFTVNEVAGLPSNLTPLAPPNPDPVMVTVVPPASGPCAGLTEATTGWTTSAVVMPRGKVNPVTVAVTVLVARSITETVPEPLLVT